MHSWVWKERKVNDLVDENDVLEWLQIWTGFKELRLASLWRGKRKEHGKLNGNCMDCCLVINLKVHIYEVEYIGSWLMKLWSDFWLLFRRLLIIGQSDQ